MQKRTGNWRGCVLISVGIIVALVFALTLIGPSLSFFYFYGANWVVQEPSYQTAAPGHFVWKSGSAVSPDGKKTAAIESNFTGNGEQSSAPCGLVVRVREAASKQVLATLGVSGCFAAEDMGIARWHPSRVAWVDDSTVAIDSDGLLLWNWTVFLFPFGTFWVIIWGIVLLAAVAGAVLARRRRMTPQAVE
jgi:hypothetical protein